MDFYYITKNLSFDCNHNDGSKTKITLIAPTEAEMASGKIPMDKIYGGTFNCVENTAVMLKNQKQDDILVKRLSEKSKKAFYGMPTFPICLTNFDGSEDLTRYMSHQGKKRIPSTPFIPLKDLVKPILKKNGNEKIKVAIVNGMGTGIGDSIVGLRALNIFYAELSKYFKNIDLTLLQTPFHGNQYKTLIYQQEKIINRIQMLPLPLTEIFKFDTFVDFTSMVIRDNFDNQPMIDFYLDSLAIDTKAVDSKEKRSFVKLNERVVNVMKPEMAALRSLNRPLLMLHTRASVPLRSMPDDVAIKTIEYYIKNTDYQIVMADCPAAIEKAFACEERFTKIQSGMASADYFSYIVSQVDAIVTVDTVTYHIADSFNKPTAVIFTSIDPGIRIQYYPYVGGVALAPQDKNPIAGKHIGYTQQENDLAAQLWTQFNPADTIQLLDIVKSKPKEMVACPICNSQTEDLASDRFKSFRLITCTHCHSEFSVPRIEANYDDMYANEYKHYLPEGEPDAIIEGFMSQWRFEPIRGFLKTYPKGKSLLDFGCATGFLPAYARNLGFDAWGVDISKEAIQYGSEKFKLGDRLQVGNSLKKLPKTIPQEYDIITSLEILEHLANPQEFVKQVYDKLTPGGIWIFSTPNRDRLPFKMGIKNVGKHSFFNDGDYPSEHLTRFRKLGHKVIAENAGFKVLNSHSCRLGVAPIVDGYGAFPQVNVKVEDKQYPLDNIEMNNRIHSYIQPLCEATEDYGNFLITICQKPF
jgi:2-polyprenyl-3-methyl-5-hydroxy-6-metoxy-1,4-benzoquinol methylase/ADP-heptose:LPS heptosyltransferase